MLDLLLLSLAHNSMYLDMGFETLNLELCELKL